MRWDRISVALVVASCSPFSGNSPPPAPDGGSLGVVDAPDAGGSSGSEAGSPEAGPGNPDGGLPDPDTIPSLICSSLSCTCPTGSSCNFTCPAQADCKMTCEQGSRCKMTCTTCTVTCYGTCVTPQPASCVEKNEGSCN
jgi:hypothetical protein